MTSNVSLKEKVLPAFHKSWARAKQKKEEFNIFIEKEKEIRNQLNSKVSIKRNETEKVIKGIISIKQIK